MRGWQCQVVHKWSVLVLSQINMLYKGYTIQYLFRQLICIDIITSCYMRGWQHQVIDKWTVLPCYYCRLICFMRGTPFSTFLTLVYIDICRALNGTWGVDNTTWILIFMDIYNNSRWLCCVRIRPFLWLIFICIIADNTLLTIYLNGNRVRVGIFQRAIPW